MQDSVSSSLADGLSSQPWSRRLWWGGMVLFAVMCGFSITGAQIGLGLAFIGVLVERQAGRTTLHGVSFGWAILGLLAAALVSLVNAVELWRGVTELKKFLIFFVFLIPFWSGLSRDDQRRLLLILLGYGAVSSIIGLTGIIGQIQRGEIDMRARGWFSMSITFGECMAIYLMTTLAWLKSGEENPVYRRFLWLFAVFHFAGLVAAATRGAFVGFGLGFLVLLGPNWKRLFMGLAAVALIVLVSTQVFRSDLDATKLDSNKPQSIGGNLRWGIWKVGLELISRHPFIGVGLNNVKPQFRAWLAAHPEHENREAYGHLHNNFLQFQAMMGIFGTITFLWLLFAVGRFCYTQPQLMSDPWQAGLASGALAVWITFIGTGFTEYSFGDEEFMMLVLFVLGVMALPAATREVAADSRG